MLASSFDGFHPEIIKASLLIKDVVRTSQNHSLTTRSSCFMCVRAQHPAHVFNRDLKSETFLRTARAPHLECRTTNALAHVHGQRVHTLRQELLAAVPLLARYHLLPHFTITLKSCLLTSRDLF